MLNPLLENAVTRRNADGLDCKVRTVKELSRRRQRPSIALLEYSF